MWRILKFSVFYFLFFGLIFSCPQKIFAYDSVTTHPALTDEIVDFYNLSDSGQQITPEQKDWLIEGSVLEDIPPRWVNHFYDPVRKLGWTGAKTGNMPEALVRVFAFAGLSQEGVLSALEWVNNSLIQEKYRLYGGDRTWQRALDYYTEGNLKESYKTLGYILHLLEDMAVPEHTRDDTHAEPLKVITGDDGSPYESYTAKWTRDNLKIADELKKQNLKPVIKTEIEDFLISLAEYSNRYFFSKDTIQDAKYEFPKIVSEDGKFGYGFDENGQEFALVRMRKKWNEDIKRYEYEFEILNKPAYYPILDAYFSRLSRQAVLHGAGALALFQSKLEEAIIRRDFPVRLVKYDTSRITIPMVSLFGEGVKALALVQSFFGNIASAAKNTFFAAVSLVKDTFFGKDELVENIALDDSQFSFLQEQGQEQTQNEVRVKEKEFCNFASGSNSLRKTILINEVAWMGTVKSASDEWIELKNISGSIVDVSGYEILDKQEDIKIRFPLGTKINAGRFLLLERTDDESAAGVSADLIYQGALSNENEGLRLFDANCNLLDEVIASKDWSAGDNSLKKTMERAADLSWHTSAAVAGTAKKENSQVVKKEEVVKELDEKDEEKLAEPKLNEVLEDEENDEKETATSTILTTKATTTLEVVLPATIIKQCSFNTSFSPTRSGVVINEIAWMGGLVSFNDEWIELKNISGAVIDISNWQILDKDEQIKIIFPQDTLILAYGFKILERTDDDTVLGIKADVIYTGALSNTGEGLRLFNKNCELIDEALASGDWLYGDNADKSTMERRSDFSWQTSAVPGGTPKAENSSGKVIYSGGGGAPSGQNPPTSPQTTEPQISLAITEIMYDVSGLDDDREWIEIFNSGTSSVDITSLRFFEDNTNHTLSSAQGGNMLGAGEYAIIADDAQKFLEDNPGYTGKIFDSAFSLSKTGETIAIKNGDTVLNEVSYTSGSGAQGDGNSLQLIDGNWVATNPTPGRQNHLVQNSAPYGFFSYSPSELQEGDNVLFNAASSSDADGLVVVYEWDFGDGSAVVSTSSSGVSHIYNTAGNYSAWLTVFDNDNASSSLSLLISIAELLEQEANNIVISEIQVGGVDSGDEFIELYNPTAQEVILDGWSVQYVSGTASSTVSAKKKNFETGQKIAAKSFFLVAREKSGDVDGYTGEKPADLLHRSFSLSGASSGGVVFLASTTNLVSDINDESVVDYIAYGNAVFPGTATSALPEAGKSLERKAWQAGVCAPAVDDSEYLGNSCDNDLGSDFEFRDEPAPQNSLSLREPRDAPSTPLALAGSSGIGEYSSSSLRLNFNWQPSLDFSGASTSVSYELKEEISEDWISVFNSTSTSFSKLINELGRNYEFYLQAFDVDGLGSASSIFVISVPSVFAHLYFYKDPRDGENYLLDMYYDKYPFAPDLYWISQDDTWKAVVFYLNTDARKLELLGQETNWAPSDLSNVLKLKYKECWSGSEAGKYSLILPDIAYRCSNTGGGLFVSSMVFSNLEDEHLLIKTASSTGAVSFSSDDYVTAAFYSFYAPGPILKLTAVDKTRYYFQDTAPIHLAPEPTSSLNVSYNETNALVNLSWQRAIDSDTLDSLVRYEVNYSTSSDFTDTQWFSVGTAVSWNFPDLVSGEQYVLGIRAIDDFQNVSQVASTTYVVPIPNLPFGLTNLRWGSVIGTSTIELSFDYSDYEWLVSSYWTAFAFYKNTIAPHKTATYTLDTLLADGLSKLGVSYQGCAEAVNNSSYFLLRNAGIDSCSLGFSRRAYNFTGSPPSSGTITIRANGSFTSSDFITLLFFRNISGENFTQSGRYTMPIYFEAE